MGLPRHFRIERGTAEEADGMILVDRRQNSGGKKEKYAFARNDKKGERLLRIKHLEEKGSEDSLAGNRDFISLSKPKKRKRSDSDSSEDGNYERNHFQLIETKAGDKPEDPDLVYTTESDSDAEGRTIKVEDATRQKHIELSRAIDKNPQDVEAWLALIAHQDAMLGLGDNLHRKITTAEIQSTADIKISMYQKALKAAGGTLQNRERLLLGMMKEGSKIWTQAEQSGHWEMLTRQEVGSSVLWKRYVDFRMSDFQGFGYEDLKQLYQDRISLLATAKEERSGKLAEEQAMLEGIHQQMIYVLLRATLFMRAMGHTELSVAVWQAALERNLSCHRDDDGARKDDLEEFWESEAPRIGEKGAKGWKEFTSIETEAPPEIRRDKETPSSYRKKADVLAGWAAAERFRATVSRWPAKTCDETVEDDPYRVILWNDIKDFVIDVGFMNAGRWEISKVAHRMLVDGFLMFCRLPPLVRAGWYNDQFCLDNLIDVSSEHIGKEYIFGNAEAEKVLDPLDTRRKDKNHDKTYSNIFASNTQNFVGSTDTMFPSKSWANSLRKWSDLYTDDPSAGSLDFRFVQRSLDTLARSYPTDELAEYYLAWMFINQPWGIQKLAGDLISKRPHSRRLYNAYALILWNQDTKEKAIGVWTQVLGMPDSATKDEKINDILLWGSRIRCHLGDGDTDMALKCLLGIGGDAAAVKDVDIKSSVLHLRAKQHLSSARDFLLASGSPSLAALNAECLSLLYYLSSSSEDSTDHRDIEGALGVIDHFTASLNSYNHHLSTHHESILQSSARLLWCHICSGPFRPALVRERMTAALEFFPQNTIFLSLYAWNESRARIDDRVRAMLRDRVLLPEYDCITSRLFAVRHEMQRGNKHSVKAAFEHAIESEAGKGSAGLWRLYLLWCAQNQDEKIKEQAKEVLYRGMRACPGVKQLMMEAFEMLRPMMEQEDLKSVYKVMDEKEVRVHVDLEEWMEEHLYGESDSTAT